MKRRFADCVKDDENVLEIQQKMISRKSQNFTGDVFLNHFIKVKEKYLIEDKICLKNDNYKWVQFYDYRAKVCLTAIYNHKNEIVEWYFDVAKKIGKENSIPYEDDLYLDIVIKPDGAVILLDENELEDAFARHEISKAEYDEAYETVNDLMKKVEGKINKLKKFTDEYLKSMLEINL